MDKNLPANERDMGLIPGPGRFPHAKEQQSSCVTTTESVRLEPVLHEKRSHSNGKLLKHKSSSCSPEKAHAKRKRKPMQSNEDPAEPKKRLLSEWSQTLRNGITRTGKSRETAQIGG